MAIWQGKIGHTAALVLLLTGSAWAQVTQPPEVHWIGPESACDYGTIQEALGDIYNCGGAICPPVENELRLSRNYVHSGQISMSRSVTVVGGFAGGCGSSTAGSRSILGEADPNSSLLTIDPGNRVIRVTLTRVRLEGSGLEGPPGGGLQGGVIHMAAGDATLILDRSVVAEGLAVQGGAIYLGGDGPKLVIDASFVSDSEAIQGGGIFCQGAGLIDLQRGRIENNVALLDGGGVYLSAGCQLKGTTPGHPINQANRAIAANTVTELNQGRGAGIFALNASVRLGALYSFTEIEDNIVETFRLTGMTGQIPNFDQHQYDAAGVNQGGGVYLEHSQGTFLNTRFVRNEAADGGALAVVGESRVVIDRSTGPCRVGDNGNAYDCSLIFGNRARGGREGDSDEAGDGSALFADIKDGFKPDITLSRSLVTSNRSGCFEPDEPDFEGECDLDAITGTGEGESFSSLVRAATANIVLAGNLWAENDIGDFDDCGILTVCEKHGIWLDIIDSDVLMTENTLAENSGADSVMFLSTLRPLTVRLYNNIVVAPATDDFLLQDFAHPNLDVSSCDISNFAAELNLSSDSIPIAASDLDPLLVDPANGNYHPMVPQSPAIDRCDDGGGAVTSTYDIFGNPRPIDRGMGPGNRDVGAIEIMTDSNPVPVTTDIALELQSALPRSTPLGVAHDFVIEVTNLGRSSTGGMTVNVQAAGILESISGQVVPDGMGGLLQHWNCVSATCEYVGPPLAPGVSAPAITAKVSFLSDGTKEVFAAVALGPANNPDVTPANNSDSDTVTVGDGANLRLSMFVLDSGSAAAGQWVDTQVFVANEGPETASNVSVLFSRSHADTILGNVDAPGWVCSEVAGGNLNCSLIQSLASFGSASMRFGATAPDTGGVLPLIRSVTGFLSAGSPADPETGNNTDEIQFQILDEDLFRDSFEGEEAILPN